MAKKSAAAARAETLLVEILTEELPPKSLEALARAFRDSLTHALESAGLRSSESGSRYFATPRRLAVAVSLVRAAASASRDRVLGPSAKAPAEAVAGFARKHGATVAQLARGFFGEFNQFFQRFCRQLLVDEQECTNDQHGGGNDRFEDHQYMVLDQQNFKMTVTGTEVAHHAVIRFTEMQVIAFCQFDGFDHPGCFFSQSS